MWKQWCYFYAKIYSETLYWLFFLFQLSGKSRFSRFPHAKKFYNIGYREREWVSNWHRLLWRRHLLLFSDEQLNKTKQRSQICSKEFSGHQSVCKPLILVSSATFFSLEIVLYPTFSLWCTPSYTDRIVSQPIFKSFADKKLQNLQLYLSTFATK